MWFCFLSCQGCYKKELLPLKGIQCVHFKNRINSLPKGMLEHVKCSNFHFIQQTANRIWNYVNQENCIRQYPVYQPIKLIFELWKEFRRLNYTDKRTKRMSKEHEEARTAMQVRFFLCIKVLNRYFCLIKYPKILYEKLLNFYKITKVFRELLKLSVLVYQK